MPTVLKNTSTKITNMLSIKKSSMLMISVSENFLVESEWGFFTKKNLSLPSTMYLYLRWPFFILAYEPLNDISAECVHDVFIVNINRVSSNAG
jgi:hypothetical protein